MRQSVSVDRRFAVVGRQWTPPGRQRYGETMTLPARLPRRELMRTAGVAGIGLLSGTRPGTAAGVHRVPRPTPPYRVWFQPRMFHRDMDLYRHMTIDASGWLDPRICAAADVTGLRWVYGTNHPETPSADYWVSEAATETRSVPRDAPEVVSAGIAIDEWVTPRQPEVEDSIATGLRTAKTVDPDLFVAVWYTACGRGSWSSSATAPSTSRSSKATPTQRFQA